ncbi:unnamed protein product [Sphagnum jensenii]|uniref:Uncharacterized protein n=1 Tax=Sphagnum jensenii TaxID=128206 RepID=A0ABP0VEA4_9BRYO
MGRPYGNIGNAYSSLKQYSEAIKYHKQELQISKEVHDCGAEASTHGNLAVAYQALGISGSIASSAISGSVGVSAKARNLLESQQRHEMSGNAMQSQVQSMQSYEAFCKVLIALNRNNDALIIAERSRTRPLMNGKQGFRLSFNHFQ